MDADELKNRLDALAELRAEGTITLLEWEKQRAALITAFSTGQEPAAVEQPPPVTPATAPQPSSPANYPPPQPVQKTGAGLMKWGLGGCIGVLALIGLLVVGGCVVLFAAFSTADDETPRITRDTTDGTATVTPADGAAEPNAKPRIGDTSEIKGSKYTVNEVRDNLPASRIGGPKPGMRWMAVDITQESVSSNEPFNLFYLSVQDAKAFRYSPGLVFEAPEPGFSSGELQPGEKVRGWVSFEIPIDAEIVAVLAQPEPIGGTVVIADLTQ